MHEILKVYAREETLVRRGIWGFETLKSFKFRVFGLRSHALLTQSPFRFEE